MKHLSHKAHIVKIEKALEKYLRAKDKLANTFDDGVDFLREEIKGHLEVINAEYNYVVALGYKTKDHIDFVLKTKREYLIDLIEKEKIEKAENDALEATFTGKKFVTCRRCKGKGVLDCYTHVDMGVCYGCRGKGKVFSAAYKRHMNIIEDDLPY